MEFDLNGCLECFACISSSETLRTERRAALIKEFGGSFLGKPQRERLNSLTKLHKSLLSSLCKLQNQDDSRFSQKNIKTFPWQKVKQIQARNKITVYNKSGKRISGNFCRCFFCL